MSRRDETIRRFWQEWVDSDKFQSHDSSSRRRATTDREDRLIRNLRSYRPLRLYRPLRQLPLTPTRCRARLYWCLFRSGWNHVAGDESRFQLCPADHQRRLWRPSEQRADPAFTITRLTGPQPAVILRDAISFDS
ncbi:transposable element Tc1 transposase [Trichonephila clavipes]|nr:transposable element Tc1 transposase [Trichonephila clavipes]